MDSIQYIRMILYRSLKESLCTYENFEVKLLSLISQNDQTDGSPISRTQYLHCVLIECCQIFKIGNGHNYLGRKPLKCAICKNALPVIQLTYLMLVDISKIFSHFHGEKPLKTLFS